jgi:hypothetical protein
MTIRDSIQREMRWSRNSWPLPRIINDCSGLGGAHSPCWPHERNDNGLFRIHPAVPTSPEHELKLLSHYGKPVA